MLAVCYLFVPLTGIGFWMAARGNRRLRFHARQSTAIGVVYIGVLLGLSFLDAVGGAFFRWAGAFVAAAAPIFGVFVAMVWVVVVVKVMRGEDARIPLIWRWAQKS